MTDKQCARLAIAVFGLALLFILTAFWWHAVDRWSGEAQTAGFATALVLLAVAAAFAIAAGPSDN